MHDLLQCVTGVGKSIPEWSAVGQEETFPLPANSRNILGADIRFIEAIDGS